jgi:hypothetical protein
MDGTSSAISPRALALAAAALAALLAVGVLTLGLGGAPPAAAQTATGGCVSGPFTYDAAEARRQLAFEARLDDPGAAPLPAFGFHAGAQDETATLHAASHAWVVVFYRPGIDTSALRALAAAAVAQKVPLVAAPRRQREALVAITQDRRIACAGASTDAVREFAAAYYPSLAA